MFETAVRILFYINVGLLFCAGAQAAYVFVLCKKTAYRIGAGLAAGILAALSIVGFAVQLIMYSTGLNYYGYVVIAVTAFYYVGFISMTVYCECLGKRSNTGLCHITGFMALIPVVGTLFEAALVKRLHTDTRAQALVYDGYAYTIAALKAFVDKYPGKLKSTAHDDSFDELTPKEAKRYVKQLKAEAKDGNGLFRYGAALLHYFPSNSGAAISALNKAAKLGNADALYELGKLYESGEHVKPNMQTAKDFYARASELDHNDAQLRLGVVDIKQGNAEKAVAIFRTRAEGGDHLSRYNYALLTELGEGVEKNIEKAVELYCECAEKGIIAAQRRLFAIAASSVGTVEHDDAFKAIAARSFEGELGHVMRGVIAIKERRASDAATEFLRAVRCRGEWEGTARLYVGTLYLDCGKLDSDRRNGAAYIKSAIDISPLARDIYLTVPNRMRKENNVKPTANKRDGATYNGNKKEKTK